MLENIDFILLFGKLKKDCNYEFNFFYVDIICNVLNYILLM